MGMEWRMTRAEWPSAELQLVALMSDIPVATLHHQLNVCSSHSGVPLGQIKVIILNTENETKKGVIIKGVH